MAEVGKTVEGVNGEEWHAWLVSDKKEILDIKKPKLQTHLRLLARRDDGMNTPDYLQEVHTNLEKMIVENEITLEEAGPWMIKIENRHKTLIEKENNIPDKSFPQEIKVILPEKDIDAGFESQLQEKIKALKKEQAGSSEWAKVILEGLDFAEEESGKERKKSTKDEKPEYWDAVEKIIQEIPSNIGEIDRSSNLAKFLSKEYKNGLTFKDRLNILYSARKHLNDRFIEMSRAGGSLTKMGVNTSGEMPFEGITYKIQPINPEDFEMLYHQRELFPELKSFSKKETSELLSDLDTSSCKWLDVGIKNNSLPEDLLTTDEVDIIKKVLNNKKTLKNYYAKEFKNKKIDKKKYEKIRTSIGKMSLGSNWIEAKIIVKPLINLLKNEEILTYANIPTFDNSFNNSSLSSELRKRMALFLKSNKSEDLSYKLLTCTLTLEMLDRNRSDLQGSSEARDLMWIDRKRLFEMSKEREPGLDWTVHRYFLSRPDAGEVIKDEEAKESAKLKKRKDVLEINVERGILVEGDGYFEGEIMSDFFHNVQVYVPDSLKPGENIRRNLASYVITNDGGVREGGFKKIPFLQMGTSAYSAAGYWGYTLAKASQLATEISSTTYKKADEELVNDDWWNKKRDLFERLEHMSPQLIIIEFESRGKEIREILRKDKRFNENEINKILGYSGPEDLDVISNAKLRNEALLLINDKKQKDRIIKEAENRAKEIKKLVINKFRMVHALGVVWPGSLDAIENTSGVFDKSLISYGLLQKIIRAIKASRYLEGEYLDRFKTECAEMGFGDKMVKKKTRYRLEVDKSLWE